MGGPGCDPTRPRPSVRGVEMARTPGGGPVETPDPGVRSADSGGLPRRASHERGSRTSTPSRVSRCLEKALFRERRHGHLKSPGSAWPPIGSSSRVHSLRPASRARATIRPRSQRVVVSNRGSGRGRGRPGMVDRPFPPRTGTMEPPGSLRTVGPLRPAQRRPDVHQRVGPVPGRSRGTASSASRWSSAGVSSLGPAGDDAAQDAAHVRVHGARPARPNASAATARAVYGPTPGSDWSARHGPTAPGRRTRRRSRRAARHRCERPTVVAEALPRPQRHRPGLAAASDLDRGEPGHEPASTPRRRGRPASAAPSPPRRGWRTDRWCRGTAASRARRVPGEDGVADRGREVGGSGGGSRAYDRRGDEAEVAMRFGAAFWVNRTSWAELRDAVPRGRARRLGRCGSTTTCSPTRATPTTRSSRAGRRCPPLAVLTERGRDSACWSAPTRSAPRA